MVLKGYRVWMHVFLPLAGCPFRIRGKERLKGRGPFVVVANHRSFMDILVMTPFVPGVNKTLAKKEFASIPIFGLIYRAGSVLVDRKNPASRAQSYEAMKEVLRQGMHMIIYPEGTRNTTTEPLRAFQDGAFALAIDMQCPIVPAVLFHTEKSFRLTPDFIFVRIGLNCIFCHRCPYRATIAIRLSSSSNRCFPSCSNTMCNTFSSVIEINHKTVGCG